MAIAGSLDCILGVRYIKGMNNEYFKTKYNEETYKGLEVFAEEIKSNKKSSFSFKS